MTSTTTCWSVDRTPGAPAVPVRLRRSSCPSFQPVSRSQQPPPHAASSSLQASVTAMSGRSAKTIPSCTMGTYQTPRAPSAHSWSEPLALRHGSSRALHPIGRSCATCSALKPAPLRTWLTTSLGLLAGRLSWRSRTSASSRAVGSDALRRGDARAGTLPPCVPAAVCRLAHKPERACCCLAFAQVVGNQGEPAAGGSAGAQAALQACRGPAPRLNLPAACLRGLG